MDILASCRVCFANNVKMLMVINTPLQELYEKLTNVKLANLSNKAGHLSICTMCHARLQRCYSFQQAATRAENLLAQLYLDRVVVTHDILSMVDHPLMHAYVTTPVEYVNIYCVDEGQKIKEEGEDRDGSRDDEVNEPTEESPQVDMKLKYESEIYETTLSAGSDSDEDLPLDMLGGRRTASQQTAEEVEVEGNAESREGNGKKRRYNEPTEEIPQVDMNLKYKSEIYETTLSAGSDSDEDLPLDLLGGRRTGGVEVERSTKSREGGGKNRRYNGSKLDIREIVLTYDQQKEAMSARAASQNYLNSPHRCDLCYRGFINREAYTNHVEKHVESSGEHVCPLCFLRYRSARLLRAHAHSSHARQYICNACGHASNTREQASDHTRVHSGDYYECKLCGKSFRARTSYLTHLRTSHPDGAAHVCHSCGERFVSEHGVRMHRARAHARPARVEEKPSTPESRFCTPCDIQFATRRAWVTHILTTPAHRQLATNTKECQICTEEVPSPMSTHLAWHEKELKRARARPAEAPPPGPAVDCEQCPLRFGTRGRLRAHVRRVHLGLKYNMNLVCELCGKKCTSGATLRYHQRTHTGERPHACAACGKRFADTNQLRIHTRTHTGERPYGCEHCGRRFAQKPALNRHYRVHTGAKPYSCELCAKSFSQSNSLNTHVKAVHLKMTNPKKRSRTTCVRKTNDGDAQRHKCAATDSQLTDVKIDP